MRQFFYLRCLWGFALFVLTKDHPGKQFEPQLEFIIWKPSGRGEKGSQPIKLKMGFFSLIKLKPKQHLTVSALDVAKTWQHFRFALGSLEPVSRAGTRLSFCPCSYSKWSVGLWPQCTGSWSCAHTDKGTSRNNFVQKEQRRLWFCPWKSGSEPLQLLPAPRTAL